MLRCRTPSHGASSPVSCCWGRFDLHHARFPGRPHARADRDAGPILRYLPCVDLRVQVDPDAALLASSTCVGEGSVPAGRAP